MKKQILTLLLLLLLPALAVAQSGDYKKYIDTNCHSFSSLGKFLA